MNHFTRSGLASGLALVLNVSTILAADSPGSPYVADRWWEDGTTSAMSAPPTAPYVADRWWADPVSGANSALPTAPSRAYVADRWYDEPVSPTNSESAFND